MALAPASTDLSGAITDIRAAMSSVGILADTIVVLDPNTETTTPYDPITDTGGVSTPTVVLGPRAAYVKALGSTAITEAGLLQGVMRFRVQFIPEDGDALMTKGLIIRVLPGGPNSVLAHFPIEVLAAPNGSIAALTKVEGSTNGTPTDPWSA